MMKHFMPMAAAFAAVIAVPAHAESPLAISSAVQIEKTVEADGKTVTTMAPADVVVPGDRLYFTLSYENRGAEPADDVVLTNPIPDSVAFVSFEGPGAELSVDGGEHWGDLASLTVEAEGTSRAATANDVTHVRWVLPTLAPGANGTVGYFGVVR